MKELIPEFFSLPEMFVNSNDYRLSRDDDDDDENESKALGHVQLPKWAQTPEEFVRLNRAVRHEDPGTSLRNYGCMNLSDSLFSRIPHIRSFPIEFFRRWNRNSSRVIFIIGLI